jgi:hypothetical protein
LSPGDRLLEAELFGLLHASLCSSSRDALRLVLHSAGDCVLRVPADCLGDRHSRSVVDPCSALNRGTARAPPVEKAVFPFLVKPVTEVIETNALFAPIGFKGAHRGISGIRHNYFVYCYVNKLRPVCSVLHLYPIVACFVHVTYLVINGSPPGHEEPI